ncbi:MAG TPA: hypothetical protein VGB48_06005 [Allosphingosinicella sp.]|jgi:hypothetical protein
MRMMILAGAVLALSACGGGETEANNTMAADNMMAVDPMMDPNMSMNGMDANMSGNMAGSAGGAMTGNGAMDAGTANAMAVDANTNSPDTNLANGL